MRVTNNMITYNTKTNINSNKVLVDKYNTQMTTQKKISKASENPVIAIRALRMQTNLSHITQYLDNNIEDANAWIDITETALTNMKNVLTDIRTQCVNGSTDTLTADDRNTILKSLKSLQDQVYTEGNADYAGRTVFTGYRTNCQLTFMEDEQETEYKIKENFTFEDLKDHRYYYGETEVPVDATAACTEEIGTNTYSRLRMAYGQLDGPDVVDDTQNPPTMGPSKIEIKVDGDDIATKINAIAGAATPPATGSFTEYATDADWIAANGGTELGDYDVIFIRDTGEMVFGKEIAHQLARDKASFEISYTKTGFDEGEPRPEYYFDCSMHTPDMPDGEYVNYTKENQQITYVISSGITLPVNTQASEVFGPEIGRDVVELIDIVTNAIAANDKVAKIEAMMKRDQFAGEKEQKVLKTYLDAAKKEADYANDHLQKTYSQYITNFDNYLERVNHGITNIGSLQKRLDLTQNRVENQKMTVEELKSKNEDRDISDIIIDYYASYNAYTASLTAASKVGQQTLLNYL